jgi:hypothetical protein
MNLGLDLRPSCRGTFSASELELTSFSPFLTGSFSGLWEGICGLPDDLGIPLEMVLVIFEAGISPLDNLRFFPDVTGETIFWSSCLNGRRTEGKQ